MTPQELGKVLAIIRDEILKISQEELAAKLDVSQSVVSRMERGLGTLEYLCSLITFFKEQGIKTHMIWFEPFQKDLLLQTPTTNVEQIRETIREMKDDTVADYNRLIMLVNAL